MPYRKETHRMESVGSTLVSILTDYARFCEMLANGVELAGVRVLNPAIIQLVRTNVLRDQQNINIAGTST